MKNLIRKWLGIDKIIQRNELILSQTMLLENSMKAMHLRQDVVDHGIGRIVAKLDPMFSVSEHDKERKAESDRLGEEVIRKLTGEVVASNNFGGRR